MQVGKVVTTGAKGQVVIPAEIRRQIGLEPGQRVSVELRDDTVIIRPIPRDLRAAMKGCLRDGPSLTAILEREHAKELERDEQRGV